MRFILVLLSGLFASDSGAQLPTVSVSTFFVREEQTEATLNCKNLSTLPQSLNVTLSNSDGSTASSTPLVAAAYESISLPLSKDFAAGSVTVSNMSGNGAVIEPHCYILSLTKGSDESTVRSRRILESGFSGNAYFSGGVSSLRILNPSSTTRTFKINVFNRTGALDYSRSPSELKIGPNALEVVTIGAGALMVEVIPDTGAVYGAWMGETSAREAAQVCRQGAGATFMLRGNKHRMALNLSNPTDGQSGAVIEFRDADGNIFSQTDAIIPAKSSQRIELSQFLTSELVSAASMDLRCNGTGRLVGTVMSEDGRVSTPQPLGNLRRGRAGLYAFREKDLLMVGDSVSQAFSELGSDFNFSVYLQLLKERSINSFMIWSYIAGNDQLEDQRIGYAAPRIFPWINEGEGASLRFNFFDNFGGALFNERYFEHLENLIAEANEKGIVVVVTVHDGWAKTRFDGHPMNRANGGFIGNKADYVRLASYTTQMPDRFDPKWDSLQKHQFVLEQFTKRLVDTVAGYPNVALEVFNEGEWYDNKALVSFQQHFSRIIRERSGLPIIINRESQSDPAVTVAEVSGMSIHSPRWSGKTSAYSTAKQVARHTGYGSGPKPVLFTEPVPEYKGFDTQGMVRLMWGSLMAKSGFFVPNDTLWKISLTSAPDPIFVAEGTASKLFNQAGIDIGSMVVGSDDDCGGNLCLIAPQEEYLVYYEGRKPVELNLNGPVESSYKVNFINPITGFMIPLDTPINGGGIVSISLPTLDEDWLVWAKKNSP